MVFENGVDKSGTFRPYVLHGVDPSGSVKAITVSEQGELSFASAPPGTDTPTYSLQSGVYTVAAGAKRVYIANVGTADGLVLGTALAPNISIPFESSQGNTLSAIAVDGTGTTLAIVEIR